MKNIFFFFLFLLIAQTGFSQKKTPQQLNQQITHWLDSLRQIRGFSGASVAYILPKGKIETISVGYANTETKQLMQPEDKMLSGSTGKSFFATLTLLLAEEKKLQLDDKISLYLSKTEWFSRLPNHQDITIRMLLNHTSGIEEYYELGDFLQRLTATPNKVWKTEELLGYVFDRKPLFKAGEGWSYADTNYLILGIILEKILDNTLYEEVEKRFFKPLQLNNIHPSTSRTLKGLIPGYSPEGSPFGFSGSSIRDGKLVFNPQFEWTGGGFYTTPTDLARWFSYLHKGKILSKKSYKEIIEGKEANTGKDEFYGLGVQIRPSNWGKGYGHGGWFPGYLTECEYFPELDVTVVIQFNTDDFSKLKSHPRKYVLDITSQIADYLKHK